MQNDSDLVAYVKATQKNQSEGFDIRVPAKFARYIGMQKGEFLKVTINGDSIIYTMVDGRHTAREKPQNPPAPSEQDPDILPATSSVASRLLKRFVDR